MEFSMLYGKGYGKVTKWLFYPFAIFNNLSLYWNKMVFMRNFKKRLYLCPKNKSWIKK